jgi:hypothetical protein
MFEELRGFFEFVAMFMIGWGIVILWDRYRNSELWDSVKPLLIVLVVVAIMVSACIGFASFLMRLEVVRAANSELGYYDERVIDEEDITARITSAIEQDRKERWPSDEEIEDRAIKFEKVFGEGRGWDFKQGALWLRSIVSSI